MKEDCETQLKTKENEKEEYRYIVEVGRERENIGEKKLTEERAKREAAEKDIIRLLDEKDSILKDKNILNEQT